LIGVLKAKQMPKKVLKEIFDKKEHMVLFVMGDNFTFDFRKMRNMNSLTASVSRDISQSVRSDVYEFVVNSYIDRGIEISTYELEHKVADCMVELGKLTNGPLTLEDYCNKVADLIGL
jgi:hypothetical protein